MPKPPIYKTALLFPPAPRPPKFREGEGDRALLVRHFITRKHVFVSNLFCRSASPTNSPHFGRPVSLSASTAAELSYRLHFSTRGCSTTPHLTSTVVLACITPWITIAFHKLSFQTCSVSQIGTLLPVYFSWRSPRCRYSRFRCTR